MVNEVMRLNGCQKGTKFQTIVMFLLVFFWNIFIFSGGGGLSILYILNVCWKEEKRRVNLICFLFFFLEFLARFCFTL